MGRGDHLRGERGGGLQPFAAGEHYQLVRTWVFDDFFGCTARRRDEVSVRVSEVPTWEFLAHID